MKRSAPYLPPRRIEMIEFFSGIGGMRSALEQALREEDVRTTRVQAELVSCMAYEISQKANAVYRNNFPDTDVKDGDFGVHTKLVEQLEAKQVADRDLWTMSPPCQPFTRTRMAKQRDLEDKRTAGFVAILNLLRQLQDPQRPTWILLENVEGFAGSQAHRLFQTTLKACGYSWCEGLLSPIQLGIPNHRNRYYALCEKSDRFFQRNTEMPPLNTTEGETACSDGKASLKAALMIPDPPRQALSAFVNLKTDTTDLMIPDSVFLKDWAKDLPVVSHRDTQSHCFTAAYSRQLHRATGSLLLMDPDRTESVEKSPIDRSNMAQYEGKLRRFSTQELLNLFGFPSEFGFPDTIDLSYRYKLIGNSINVSVVKELLKHLILSP